jgi:hypothetical protein
MVELIDDNEPSVLTQCRDFIGSGQRYFNANKAELNRDAETMGDVRVKYPYPPKNCEEATIILQNLDDEIKSANEKIASGVSDRPTKRYLDAFMTVRNEFKAWLNAKQCIAAALKQEDQAFTDQLQAALDKEQVQQSGKKSTDNLVIFGALGLLVVGALVIIIKKSKKAK